MMNSPSEWLRFLEVMKSYTSIEYNKREEFHDLLKNDVWIPKNSCIIGSIYLCRARNFTIGVWNGSRFDYARYKFKDIFPDTELHWDEGPPHGTVKPLKHIGNYNE
ncbi:MAG: hypothetical protein KAS32_20175 [Candidatus Peribacteraceae bacterium]|nr:hypothetical protein [Candidatus Peribacteraceae bacterium]